MEVETSDPDHDDKANTTVSDAMTDAKNVQAKKKVESKYYALEWNDMTVNDSGVNWDANIEDFANQVHEKDVEFFTNGLRKNLKGHFKTIVEVKGGARCSLRVVNGLL
jgi:hypothetical protein